MSWPAWLGYLERVLRARVTCVLPFARWRFDQHVVIEKPLLGRFVATCCARSPGPLTAGSCKRRDVFLCGREELVRKPSLAAALVNIAERLTLMAALRNLVNELNRLRYSVGGQFGCRVGDDARRGQTGTDSLDDGVNAPAQARIAQTLHAADLHLGEKSLRLALYRIRASITLVLGR